MTGQLQEMEALRWLKDAAARPDPPPDGARERVFACLSRDLELLGLGQHDAVTSSLDAKAAASTNWRQVVASRLAIWSAPALVLGAVGGATVQVTLVNGKPQVAPVERPNTTTFASAEMVERSPWLESNPVVAPDPTTAQVVAPTATAVDSVNVPVQHESSLARERAVLDRARRALAAGELARALESADRHARLFPNGIMIEEREAIAINALVSLGQFAQARRRAATFRARYPQSLLMHSVDAAIAVIPRQ